MDKPYYVLQSSEHRCVMHRQLYSNIGGTINRPLLSRHVCRQLLSSICL